MQIDESIEKLSSRTDTITQSYLDKFGKLTSDQLNWKPDEQTWSISQNIDHIMIVNESYFPLIQKAREDNYVVPLVGKFNFIVRNLGKMILRGVNPDRKMKMKTFKIWEPGTENISENILLRFESHQSELKRIFVNYKTLLEKGTVISSPVNRNIVISLGTAFDIILTHEERHLAQASELLQSMKI
jgi:hypothetical protein